MEKEVSHAVEIGVTLTVLSAVISLIWFTVFLGMQVKVDSVEQGTRIVTDLQQGLLEDMTDQQNDMPTATAYGILRAYGSVIPSVTCNIDGKVTDLTKDTPCLLEHMKGTVSLQVKHKDIDWYEVIIHKPNCTWYYTVCNCSSLP